MKITLVILIMMLFFLIGKCYKQKIVNEYLFLLYLDRFCSFLRSNINLFKIDVVKVIDEFVCSECEKSANFNKIFAKNGEIYSIDGDYLKIINSNEQDNLIINLFLSKLGEGDYDFENGKISSFTVFLNEKKNSYGERIKSKGDLTLKLLLAIGSVISILVW